MAQRARGEVPPAERAATVDSRLVELARLTGLRIRQLERFTPDQIDTMLKRARARDAREQDRARQQAERDRSNHYQPSDETP